MVNTDILIIGGLGITLVGGIIWAIFKSNKEAKEGGFYKSKN